jgi:pimeloyl-ACP methyl ester carboxylesterase
MSALAEQHAQPEEPIKPMLGVLWDGRDDVVSDNDPDLGYTLISPPTEEESFSPEELARLPLSFLRGLGKAAVTMAHYYSGGSTRNGWPEPERRIVTINGHDRSVLTTEPDPTTGVRPNEAVNDVLVPGLAEMDTGSALLLHNRMADRNPDHRTTTLTMPGISLSGQPLSIWEGLSLSLEDTAAENLQLLPRITRDGRTNFVGTSLGSYVAMLMSAQNLAANGESQLNMAGVKLVSPAVGARNVAEAERFRDVDASDKEFIADVTNRFFRHMPGDTLRMVLKHPEKAGECASVLGAYALAPHKFLRRFATLAGNLRGVQQGIEWDDIKQVALAYKVHVLGGELDPLVQEQLAQWLAVKKIAPETKIRILGRHGHAMTVDGSGTAEHLVQMEHEDMALAA